MFIGLAVFIGALASGSLAHDHGAHEHSAHCHDAHCHEAHCHETDANCTHEHSIAECNPAEDITHRGTINLLDEQWMNVLFAGLSVLVLLVLIFSSDHFVEEHLWNHIVKKHLPVIFAWTFGVLLVLGIGLTFRI